ncbi:MAG: NYN domain-containing protein [Mucispirillum sp.]|nr:NYN domain-containing protein [Mucispirillum sp.]
MNTYQQKLVVLIDADNASPAIIYGLMSEIAKYGTAYVKRIYGDWTSPKLKGWKDILLEHALQPIQQFGYTKGKNSTDSAMIIDAMDLLYTDKFDGFCIVSSDSDFTRLASRIREDGLNVYGFGEKKTPQPFISACDKFIYTEILQNMEDESESDGDKKEIVKPTKRMTTKELKMDTRLVNLLRSAVDAAMDENGWSFLGEVGQHITKQSPEFDARNYGYAKLRELVQAVQLFDIDERKDDRAPNIKQIYIKDKRRKKAEPED